MLLSIPQKRSSSCLNRCPCSSGCPHPTKFLFMGRPQGASEENPKWPKTFQHCLTLYFPFSSHIFWRKLAKQCPLLLGLTFPRLGFVGMVDTWFPCVKNELSLCLCCSNFNSEQPVRVHLREPLEGKERAAGSGGGFFWQKSQFLPI